MKIKTLKNGLKVAIDKTDTNTKLVQIGFFILGGTYTESRKSLQYYHFLEHLLAHFTSKRWPDAKKNIKKLRKRGISYHGTSGNYETHILLQGTSDQSEIMLDFLTHTLSSYQIDESIFEHEKTAVESEISEMLNEPFIQMDDEVHKIMSPKHIVSVSTKSQLRSVKSITPKDIIEFARHALTPEKVLFYMAGKVPKYTVFDQYKKILESIPPSQPAYSISSLAKYQPKNTQPGIFHVNIPTVTTRLEFRWRIPVLTFDYDNVSVVDALAYCLQKRLIKKLRHDSGLVYSIVVRSFFDPVNKNLSYLYIDTDSMTRARSKAIVLEIIRTLEEPDQLFTAELIEEYKLVEKQKYEHTKQDCGVMRDINFNSSRVLWGEPVMTHSKLYDYSKNVTAEKVLNFAKKHLSTNDVYFIYGGPDNIFR